LDARDFNSLSEQEEKLKDFQTHCRGSGLGDKEKFDII